MPFDGFDPQALALLPELPGYDKDGYEAVKGLVGAGLREPAIALVEELAPATDPRLSVDRRASLSPMHNDLRFAKPDTPRYKDCVMVTAWEGKSRKTAPTLWLRVAPSGVGFASGVGFTPAVRSAWREAVAGDAGEALAAALSAIEKKHRTHGFDVAGPATKKVPKPHDEGHPRGELLKMTGFQVRFQEPTPKSIAGRAFVDFCAKRWAELLPVHRWLVANLAAAGAK